MIEQWRTLLYPLGFLSSLCFTARFIVQWLESERAKKSVVSPLFWRLSLTGNLLLLVHSFIQIQFHICALQAVNAVISWRNLNLMNQKKPPMPLPRLLALLVFSLMAIIAAFLLQDLWLKERGELFHSFHWFRTPTTPWNSLESRATPWYWHLVGSFSLILFSSRFWIQWWLAEKAETSYLSPTFWWISLVGALLSIAYFLKIDDSVNLVGPLFGLIPYLRNLALLQKVKAT